jgi:hypothetical protein
MRAFAAPISQAALASGPSCARLGGKRVMGTAIGQLPRGVPTALTSDTKAPKRRRGMVR